MSFFRFSLEVPTLNTLLSAQHPCLPLGVLTLYSGSCFLSTCFWAFSGTGTLPHHFFISKSDPFCVAASDGTSWASKKHCWLPLPDHVLWLVWHECFYLSEWLGLFNFHAGVCQLGFVACPALPSEVHWVTSHMLQVYLLYAVMHISVPACSQPQLSSPARTNCSPDCAAGINLPVKAQHSGKITSVLMNVR